MKPQLRYALIAAVIIFAIDVVLSLDGIRGSAAAKGIGFIDYLIIAFAIIFTLREERTKEGGYLTYGRGLGLGSIVSLLTGLFVGILSYPYYKFINHGFVVYATQQTDDQMEAKLSKADEAQAQVMTKWAHMMTSPGGLSVLKFLSVFIIGFILSLIIAAVLKRDNPNPDMERNYMS